MKRIIITTLLFSLLFSLSPTLGQAKTDPQQFVRTANYFLMSGPKLSDSKTMTTLSKFDLIVIPAEAQVYNKTFFQTIRARNPDIIILAYVPAVSWNNQYWNDPLHQKLKSGIRSDYWLRDASGAQKSVWPGTVALNLHSGWVDHLSNYVAQDIMRTGYWDGVFYDEVQDTIDYIGALDTDRNGVNDSAWEANTRWQAGFKKLFTLTRQKIGNKIILTNGSSSSDYASIVDGRMYENFPTKPDPLWQWRDWTRDYLKVENQITREPITVINANTNNTGAQSDYQNVRFGLTTTLMGNGYFAFDFGDQNHAQLWTYDEYNAFLGAPQTKPNNVFNGSTTISTGVWQRDYERGKVLVNATEANQTVRLDGFYEKIHGTQDRSINDGSIVNRLTLQGRDGIILLRPIEDIKTGSFINGAFARVFSSSGSVLRNGFFTYESKAKGGNTVVRYDTDNDGREELIIADKTYVYIYDHDGRLHAKFAPYTERYNLGINIAAGDIESDGSVEIVTGTEKGAGPQMRIFNKDGNLIHPGFFAYDKRFRGGVHITIGDLNGDNIKEIIAGAGETGGPHVRVFNKDGRVINPGFFAYDPYFRGGVNVACGDVDGDGIDEIITGPGPGGGPHVRVYDRDGNLKTQFMALDATTNKGIKVATTDLDGDGRDEIVGLSTNVFTLSSY
ncbi:putative glycoside hydrolase [Patescibacteria group bacterium]